MEKSILKLGNKSMQFIYINSIHSENSWIKNISFGYYKINFFIEVDAKIIIDNIGYYPQKYDFMTYPLYSNHYGLLPHRQKVEYFEFLIPEDFFDTIDPERKAVRILESITSKKIFSLPEEHRKAFVEKIYSLRDNLRNNIPDVFAAGVVLDIIYSIHLFCDGASSRATKPLSDRLTSITSYIKDNLSEIKTVDEVAKAMNLSRAYISKLFRTEIGCTPYSYIINLKLELSLMLLRQGKNVTEACFGAGFSGCSAYIETFRKKYGTTPYRYYKNNGLLLK